MLSNLSYGTRHNYTMLFDKCYQNCTIAIDECYERVYITFKKKLWKEVFIERAKIVIIGEEF